MATSKARKLVTVRTAEDLGRALGLSGADTAEMEFRSDLTVSLAKIIQSGRITHAEIAKRAGTSRTRGTAIGTGTPGACRPMCSSRYWLPTGYRAEVRVKKTAAWISRLFKIPFDSLPVP